MKRILFFVLIAAGLVFGGLNPVYSNDFEKVKIISEIGTLANNDKYLQALDKCNEALKTYPDEPDLYYWRASIKKSMGDKKDTISDLDKAIKLNPKDDSYYVLRGICKLDLNDENAATADFNKAIELNPKSAAAYSMRACAKLSAGDYDGASADLTKANELFETLEPDK